MNSCLRVAGVLSFSVIAVSASVGCKYFFSKGTQGTASEVKELLFERSLTSGSQIGLKPGEIALTLDDGPVPETLPLAEKLRDLEVPVTYFVVGYNASANKSVLEKLSDLKFTSGPLAGQYAAIIANHTWHHARKVNSIPCVACDGEQYAVSEILSTDNLIKPLVEKQNKPFLFRAPGGNFFRPNYPQEVQQLAAVNAVLSKYIGPFFWDVDGDVNPGPCAKGVDQCKEFYLSQVRALGKSRGIIILAHDIHEKTRKMLLGYDNNEGLVSILKREGYTFVHMDKDPAALGKYGNVPANQVGDVTFEITDQGNNVYELNAEIPNAVKIEISIDRFAGAFAQGDGTQLKVARKISTKGPRVFVITGYDEAGKVIAKVTRQVTLE